MKCRNCSLCKYFYTLDHTFYGWNCPVLGDVIFKISYDESTLLGIGGSLKRVIEDHNEILDIECIASSTDIIQFMDTAQDELENINVRLDLMLGNKEDLQTDIYQASIVLGEMDTQK